MPSATELFNIYCMDLNTGRELPSCSMSKDSYPWRDLKHQMETIAMLNLDVETYKVIYFIKNEEPITKWL